MPQTVYWASTSSTVLNTSTNWKLKDGGAAAALGNGDTLIVGAQGTAAISDPTGLVALAALTGVTLIVEPGAPQIGNIATDGTPTYLKLDGGTLNIVRNPNLSRASGTSLCMVDFQDTAATVNVEYSAQNGAQSTMPPVSLLGTVLTINNTGGSVGVACRPGETATIVALKQTKGGNLDPYLMLGRGVTMTACDAVYEAGTVLDLRDAVCLSIRNGGASYGYYGTGATTTIYADDGQTVYSGTGTITTLKAKAPVNFSGDPRAKTVTDCEISKGGSVNIDNGGVVTFTNAITFPDGLRDGMLVAPAGITVTLA